jgi:vacuolar-type H+-ATPase subunit H
MVDQSAGDALDPVLQAMQRVLEAERAGQVKIEAAKERAQAISSAARIRARAISDRATARLARLSNAMAAKRKAEAADLQRAFEQQASAVHEIDQARLAAAVCAVATKLTSDAE